MLYVFIVISLFLWAVLGCFFYNKNKELFSEEIQFWTNLELLRYKTKSKRKIQAIGKEIKYRVENNIYR